VIITGLAMLIAIGIGIWAGILIIEVAGTPTLEPAAIMLWSVAPILLGSVLIAIGIFAVGGFARSYLGK